MSTEHGTSTTPPSKHQLALMIWLAVFPTLTLLNIALGGLLKDVPIVLRTFVLATLAQRVTTWLARVGRTFNRVCGGTFIAIGALLPLRA